MQLIFLTCSGPNLSNIEKMSTSSNGQCENTFRSVIIVSNALKPFRLGQDYRNDRSDKNYAVFRSIYYKLLYVTFSPEGKQFVHGVA